MLVVATALGFYGNKRIKEGQKFRIKNESEFSKKWMMEASKADKAKKAKELDAIVEFDVEPTAKEDVSVI